MMSKMLIEAKSIYRPINSRILLVRLIFRLVVNIISNKQFDNNTSQSDVTKIVENIKQTTTKSKVKEYLNILGLNLSNL